MPIRSDIDGIHGGASTGGSVAIPAALSPVLASSLLIGGLLLIGP